MLNSTSCKECGGTGTIPKVVLIPIATGNDDVSEIKPIRENGGMHNDFRQMGIDFARYCQSNVYMAFVDAFMKETERMIHSRVEDDRIILAPFHRK